ncbi:uncharacterized protein LOC114929968 [Nylanderia fulva]|uniref:uncharacterized protein LOC114929968 n=1 Tax=Nylanderia fulva TaxID=613905 RepID=UPI0010FAF107|nr:uncharacterized protein LOC114929968 [Nylanderia fulva]XP_029157529.1 uncharacterized protein LOC114929968 [Nylanderia fulva]XP_029157531.1 uncharacterized protein LOC114929968 [Nylanderia fulva]
MLSSKANAALARLKEIEEKYKIKRDEWNRQKDTDSSISSVSIIPSEIISTESKKSSRKLKLDIKIPDMRVKGRAEETKLSSESKKSTPDKMSPEPFIEDVDEADPDVTIPSKDKSQRSAGKQESLISDVTSIQENSSIESVLDDSMISSKSLSRSKTSRGNSSTASDKSSRREEKTRTTAKHEKGRESDISSDNSRRKASSGNSSIAKQSRLLEKSNEKTLKVRSAGPRSRERSIEEKAKIPKAANRNSDRSRSLRDDSVIEESIGTVDNGSEIISELSRIKTGTKTDNSIKNSSKYSATENTSATILSQLAIESGYANDTFEDVSSSTMQSQSQRECIIDEKKKIDLTGSSIKKNDTALFEQYHQNNKSTRDRHVIEFMDSKPNATEVNLDLSNYANDLESKVNSDNVSMRLIKSPNFTSSKKRYQQHRPDPSFKTNIPSATSFDENISDFSESLTGVGDVMKTDEKKNSPEIRMTSVRQESGQEERGKALNKIRERAMINITGPPAADEEDIIKSNLSEKIKARKENIFEESSGQRIFQDAEEEVFRKLHKDAFDASRDMHLVKRHASSKNAKKVSKKSSESETESEIKEMKTREENENRSLTENKIYGHKFNSQKKKKSIKVTNSKSPQARNTGSRKEDKSLRFDEKQMHGLRKRIVELRLQQEREELQKYLQELKNSRLKLDSTQSYFSPLEFPKIAEFKPPDVIDLESKLDQHVVLRERVSAIRRCLKDQYILYRDYCTMAQAINAHYVPTTLQDTKKTIRELRKMTIKNR